MTSTVKNFLASALGALFGVGFALFSLVVILPMIAFVIFAGGRHSQVEAVQPHSILHLELNGQIVEKRRPMGFSLIGERSILGDDRFMGLYELNRAIELAKTDKKIDGIYLHIGDLDAGWAAVSSLRRKLSEFAATGKWIYAYADRLNEMGYYLASVANQIVMEPSGDLEFNGLASQETFVKGLLEKLGVEPLIFRVGKFKAAIEPLTRDQMSAENREQTQALISDIWSEVRAVAAKTAKLSPERIDQMVSGLEVVSAETAKTAGLIQATDFVDVLEDRMRDQTVGKDSELELVAPGRYLREADKHKTREKKVVVIFAEGEIHSGESSVESIGSESLREEIEDAKSDDATAAIVLRVNSPGGDALASDVIWRELRKADEEIPVVVSMGDLAASGGYYIASAARYIYAEPTTITGSIGVFGIMFNAEKFFKGKAGVSFDRAVTHPYADLGAFTRPMAPIEAKTVQGEVERVYKRFIDIVQESRGFEERKDVENIAEGRVWSGTRAKEIGLVDELGGLDMAVKKAAEFADIKDYEIVIQPADADPLRHLFERLTQEMSSRVLGPGGEKLKAAAGAAAALDLSKPLIRAQLLLNFKIR